MKKSLPGDVVAQWLSWPSIAIPAPGSSLSRNFTKRKTKFPPIKKLLQQETRAVSPGWPRSFPFNFLFVISFFHFPFEILMAMLQTQIYG